MTVPSLHLCINLTRGLLVPPQGQYILPVGSETLEIDAEFAERNFPFGPIMASRLGREGLRSLELPAALLRKGTGNCLCILGDVLVIMQVL